MKTYGIELLRYYAIPHAYAGYMAKQMLLDEGIELPMVTTLHTNRCYFSWKHLFITCGNLSINNSDCVTSVSRSLKEDTQSIFNVKKEIKVILISSILPNIFIIVKNVNEILSASMEINISLHTLYSRKVKRIDDVIGYLYRNFNGQMEFERLGCE